MKKLISISLIIILVLIQTLPAFASNSDEQKTAVTLKEGDLLELDVENHPEMHQQQIIDETGNIYFSYVDHIKATGKTVEEIKKELDEQYKKHDLFLSFNLYLVKLNRKIYLVGNFNHPGEYQMNSEKVLLTEAVAMGGGPSSAADLGNVTITHENGGKKEYTKVSIKDIMNGNEKDIEIYPGDSVFIDTRFFITMQDYLPYLSILLTLAILLKK